MGRGGSYGRSKNNRRTKYTIDLIKKSFLALLETRKLPQITVTEICKQADINHRTFYLYYKDPYELFEVLQKEFNQENWIHCKMIKVLHGKWVVNQAIEHNPREENDLLLICFDAEEEISFVTSVETHLLPQQLVCFWQYITVRGKKLRILFEAGSESKKSSLKLMCLQKRI